MVQTEQSILEKTEALKAALRESFEPALAERIDEIVEDRAIWDKMALRLARTIEQILAKNQVTERVREIGQRLLAELNTTALSALRAFDQAIYHPVRSLSVEVARAGFVDWQLKVEEAITSGSTSTEIFMAIRLYLDELLKSEWPLPHDVRGTALRLRRTIDNCLTEGMDSTGGD